MSGMSARTIAALYDAVEDPAVVGRYRAMVSPVVSDRGCRLWTGAVSSRGHGRLWLSSFPVEVAGKTDVRDVCVIAHRFGYALEHGVGALLRADKVTHLCDEPLCQEPTHWRPGTTTSNVQEFHDRKHTPGSPLRDTRGARGRAVALRDGMKAGTPLAALVAAGQPAGDLIQDPLPFDCPPASPLRSEGFS